MNIRGAIDTNQIINPDYYSTEEIEYVAKAFSNIPNEREKMISELYKKMGMKYQYREYENMNHSIDSKIFLRDAFTFFSEKESDENNNIAKK